MLSYFYKVFCKYFIRNRRHKIKEQKKYEEQLFLLNATLAIVLVLC